MFDRLSLRSIAPLCETGPAGHEEVSFTRSCDSLSVKNVAVIFA